jgi:hypothetical protein
MNLTELQASWEQDCVIDDLHPDRASAKTPSLHSKYLNELLAIKLKFTKTQFDLAELRARKSRYFRGEMTREELEELGWEQWQYKTLKSDLDSLLEADREVQTINARVEYLKATIYFLESVLGEIRTRSFHCKNIIEWQKFRAGV